jgi:hypothetical protein
VHVLDGALLHWNDLSVDELAALFNRYATDEARELDRLGVRARPADVALRPVARFLWLYVRRGELRLGMRGLVHAGLKAVSEFLRYAKLWELQRGRR